MQPTIAQHQQDKELAYILSHRSVGAHITNADLLAAVNLLMQSQEHLIKRIEALEAWKFAQTLPSNQKGYEQE